MKDKKYSFFVPDFSFSFYKRNEKLRIYDDILCAVYRPAEKATKIHYAHKSCTIKKKWELNLHTTLNLDTDKDCLHVIADQRFPVEDFRYKIYNNDFLG